MRRSDGQDDLRARLLSKAGRDIGASFSAPVLANEYPRLLTGLFPGLRSLEAVRTDPEALELLLMLGAVLPDAPERQRGTAEIVAMDLPDERKIFIEQAFLGSAFSWLPPWRSRPEAACLGYVYDDLSQYYMADYPGRMTRWLNGPDDPSQAKRTRARTLIDRITSAKISKYNAQPILPLPASDRSRVLVCDQSFADASIRYGRMKARDFDSMLCAALNENPQAEILVKTHPDTAWSRGERAGYFDHLQSDSRMTVLREPINPFCLIEAVDSVYVGTSQIGLEALMAGRHVVTFGAPFYAGWGLTDDRARIPHRHRARSLEDLVHAAYIRAPLYHVPGRPAPAEVEDVLDFIEAERPVALPPTSVPKGPPEISVIVPVQNGAAWISEAIASVQKQSLTALEIVVVDDASTDTTTHIVSRLAAADPRIRLLCQEESGGPGAARNAGLDAARGAYLWLLDSDDVLADRTVLADLLVAATEGRADVVRARKAGERVLAEDGTFLADRDDPAEAHFIRAAAGEMLAGLPELAHNRHCWLLLYRRAMLEREHLRFATGFWEERAFMLAALLTAERISIVDRVSTRYTIRPGSVARREKTPRDAEDMLTNFETVVAQLTRAGAAERSSPLRPVLENTLSQFLHFLLFGFFWQVADSEEGAPRREDWLERMAAGMWAADFCPRDISPAPDMIDPGACAGGRYALALAALRARRPDLLKLAVSGAPCPQRDMIREARASPSSEIARALCDYAAGTGTRPSTPVAARTRRVRLVIHAGMSKTGTTWLQHWLAANRAPLLAQGVYYPECGLYVQPGRPHKTGGHAPFLAAAATGNPDLRTHIEAALGAVPELHTVLLSSEGFHLGPEPWRLLDHFGDMDPEVLIWLRRQDDWAASQYREYVGGGATFPVTLSPEEWLATPETQARLDYEAMLAPWHARLPNGALRLRTYPEPEGLLPAFARAAGVVLTDTMRDVPRALSNEAVLDGAYLDAMREMNARPWPSTEAYLAFTEEVHGIARRHRPDARPPLIFDTEARRRLLDMCAAGNARLAARFGLPDPLFPGTLPQGEAPSAVPLSAAERDEIEAAQLRNVAAAPPDTDETRALRDEIRAKVRPLAEDEIAAISPRLLAAGLFDAEFYLARNSDVAEAGVDPLTHFLRSGCIEARDPAAGFSTLGWYRMHPRALARGDNALVETLRQIC